MRRKMIGWLVNLLILVWAVTVFAAYPSWNNNTADLSGPASIQVRIDDLDSRLDAIGLTSSTALELNAADLTLTDDLVVGDDALFGGLITITPTALTATNGQPITVAERFYIVNGIGGADNTTNTCTVANPVTAGKFVTFIVKSDSSNLLGLADSGNLALSGAAVLDNNDNITLYAATTGTWVEVSKVDN